MQVTSVMAQLRKEPGVKAVLAGRAAEEKNVVSQVGPWAAGQLHRRWAAWSRVDAGVLLRPCGAATRLLSR
jgi:hypothetical protein